MKRTNALQLTRALGPGLAMVALALSCAPGFAATSYPTQCSTGFEGLTRDVNDRYVFRWPQFSGSTTAYVDKSHTNYSSISGEFAHKGTNSLKVEWLFTSAPARWLRLTTYQAPFAPNPQIKSSQILRFWIYVPSTTPDFYLSAGLRENGLAELACGGNGGTAGPIEFIGAAARNPYARPIGKLLGETEKDQWIQIQFVLPCEPVLPFTGNGKLDAAQAVFEQLAFTPRNPDEADVGPYVVYLDDLAFLRSLANPGDQTVTGTCEGAATWTAATLVEDCGAATVSSSHNPGEVVGFGTKTVETYAYYPTSGAYERCDYNVTVLPPVHQIEFLSPVPNLDAPHLFAVGETIPFMVRVSCGGQEVTQGITVTIDVKGLGPDGAVFHDVDEEAFGVGDSVNEALVLVDHHFMFNLTTLGFVRHTASDGRFYLVQIIATDDASGLELGRGSVVLESK